MQNAIKQKWQRVIAMILAVVMVVLNIEYVGPMKAKAEGEAEDLGSLNSFPSEVTISNPLVDEETGAFIIKPGVEYEVTLKFEEKSSALDDQIPHARTGDVIQNGDYLEYDLPDGVNAKNGQTGTAVLDCYDGKFTLDCTYEIKDSKLYFYWNFDNDNYTVDEVKYYLDISSVTWFNVR